MTREDFTDRLLRRVSPLTVSAEAQELLYDYYMLLSHWNKRINLTSLDLEPLTSEALDRLFAEPLLASRHVGFPSSWVDLGSGGGSPAVPLKILRPAARLTMIESRSRKAAFLREAARHLRLRETVVMRERFQATASHPAHIGAADLVTIRGVRIDAEVAECSRRILREDGELVVFGHDAPHKSPPGFRAKSTVKLLTGSRLWVYVPDALA